jgi:translation initiation factor 2 beta subunit (eIF-2beta)/eIF-5
LTLYNINIQNTHIKKIFIKIENNKKLTSKIYISSLPKTKEKLKIYKILNYLKFLNYIQALTIKTPEFLINYNNKYLHIIKDKIDVEIYIKSFFPNFSLTIPYFEYNDIILENINLNFKQKLTSIKVNGSLDFQQSLIKFKGKYNILFNNMNLNINANHLTLNYNDILTSFKNFNAKTNIDFQNKKISSKLKIKNANINLEEKNISIQNITNISSQINTDLNLNNVYSFTTIKKGNLYYNNTLAKIKDINISQKNKNIKFTFNKVFTNVKDLKNISIIKGKINTNLLNYQTYISTKNIKGNYKNYLIKLNNINTNIKNNSNIKIHISKANIYNDDINISLNKIDLSKKEQNISYTINSTKLTYSTKLKANSSKIQGNTNEILNKIIKGIFDNFDFEITNNKFDTKNKIFTSKKITFNKVVINNLKINFQKKYAIFTSNDYFDIRINDILKKELNISIPIIQTAGENNISAKINFDKNISFNIKAKSKNLVLKLENLPLTAKSANINITPIFTSFELNKSHLKISKKVDLLFTGEGNVTYTPLILTLKGIINNFVIDPILNIKNFKESAKMNLNTLEIFLKHSHTYINLYKKNIIINDLKPILPYSQLKDLIKNGLLYITFKDNIQVIAYIKPLLDIFYKHNNNPIKKIPDLAKLNIDKIMLNIKLEKNKIILYNDYIQFFMYKNNAFLNLNNIDINLYPLEQFYYKNKNKKQNQNKNIIINLQNSNFLYKNHKFLSQKAEISEINNSISIKSHYKDSNLTGYSKQKYFLLEGNNFSKEEFTAFLPNIDFFKEINLDFTLVKSPDDYYIGNVYINKATVNELKALNNIVAFLNTIPSLLSLSSPGFSAKGYKIKKGNIQYLLYKKILYVKKATIIGDNIDFMSKGYIDFNKNYINLKTTAILKLKLKKIPIVGKGLSYLFFGKDGSIKVNILITGDLNNPKIQKDIGKAIIPNPFNLFKRAITLPFNLF